MWCQIDATLEQKLTNTKKQKQTTKLKLTKAFKQTKLSAASWSIYDPVARATFYTVLKKGGFSLDFQAFSEFDNTDYKTDYFSGVIELHNKKG